MLIGVFLAHPVYDAAFGPDDEFLGVRLPYELEHSTGRKRVVCECRDGGGAFGVYEHDCARVFFLCREDMFRKDFVVGRAETRPKRHFPSKAVIEVCAEIGIGQKQDFPVFRKSCDQFFRISARAADIDFGFGFSRRVYICDDQRIRVFPAVSGDQLGRRHNLPSGSRHSGSAG